jgi:Tol biopolymer transport system component
MKTILLFFYIIFYAAASNAAELLITPEKIIPATATATPQAPRVSPDGAGLVYEMSAKDKVTIWHASANGGDAVCLTCTTAKSLENPFWHPSGNYLLFNAVPKGNNKSGGIYTAALDKVKLREIKQVARGARPQFSRPNGHVIFFETAEGESNILAYQILGNNPLQPSDTIRIQLRGPIQKVNSNAEVSHPSLAPDGSTIVFAARAATIKGTDSIVLNDSDRQKIYKLWKALNEVKDTKISKELERMYAKLGVSERSNEYKKYADGQDGDEIDSNRIRSFISPDSFKLFMKDTGYLNQGTIVQGYTKKHFFLAWYLGLTDRRGKDKESEVQEMLLPRLWVTDVFGAPVAPLVTDVTSTPLPQKWPTVSHDGRFVVFEAGDYTDRHIYLVAKKNGKWMDKAIRITESGSYNSSPEVDPAGQWLYFESNRDGKKGIWRAQLNWPEIDKKIGF